jgi:hypothetical protein
MMNNSKKDDGMRQNGISKNHRKKRNSLLVYEFLVRAVSAALIDSNSRTSDAALNIIKHFFKPGTELFKEFRLANSLLRTAVSSQGAARAIINEARNAAQKHDIAKLEHEKSLLIRSVNHNIKDTMFWDRSVPDYTLRATIGTLLEDWRRDDGATLDRMADYEDKLENLLIEKKNRVVSTDQSQIETSATSAGESRFLLRVMTKKLNERYGNVLTAEQKSLLKEHVYCSMVGKESSVLKPKLDEIRNNLVEAIDANPMKGEYMTKEMDDVKKNLLDENTNLVDDQMVTRFMLYIKLINELNNGEEE